jgi:hypothetical protein
VLAALAAVNDGFRDAFRELPELPRLFRRGAAPNPPPLLDTTGGDR